MYRRAIQQSARKTYIACEPTEVLEPTQMLTQDIEVPPTQLLATQLSTQQFGKGVEKRADYNARIPQTLEEWLKLGTKIKRGSKVPQADLQLRSAEQNYSRASKRKRLRSRDEVITPVPSQTLESTQPLSPRELPPTQSYSPKELAPTQAFSAKLEPPPTQLHSLREFAPARHLSAKKELVPTQLYSPKAPTQQLSAKKELAPTQMYSPQELAPTQQMSAKKDLAPTQLYSPQELAPTQQLSAKKERVPTQPVSPNELAPTQPLTPREIAFTQELSPKELASTQILSPSQEFPPLNQSSFTHHAMNAMGGTTHGLFGRSSVTGLNPIFEPEGTQRVKRSFTELVRIGLKNRERLTGCEVVQNNVERAIDSTSSVRIDKKELDTNLSGNLRMVDENNARRSPEPARATPNTDASAALQSMLSADTTGARTARNVTPMSCKELAPAPAEKFGAEENDAHKDDSTVRDLAKEFSPKGEHQVANVVDLLAGKQRVDATAVPDTATAPQSTCNNPLFAAIIQERATQGARRVAVAEKLAQQLAQRQKAMNGVYRALAAFL